MDIGDQFLPDLKEIQRHFWNEIEFQPSLEDVKPGLKIVYPYKDEAIPLASTSDITLRIGSRHV